MTSEITGSAAPACRHEGAAVADACHFVIPDP
jgi:hypothetical protein